MSDKLHPIPSATNVSEPPPKPSRKWGFGSFLGLSFVILALSGAIYFLAPALFPATFGSEAAVPEPTPIVITVESITPLGELATVDYKAMADITNQRIPDDIRKNLGVKEQIVMLVYGDVKAGFDLTKLNDDSLWVDGKRVQLVLPAPEILSTSIDYDRTRIATYNKSFLVGNDPTLQQETLGMAKEAMVNAALDGDVLQMARQYGQLFFENYLRSLGFEEVRVIIQ